MPGWGRILFARAYQGERISERSPGESSKIAPHLIRSIFIDLEIPLL
ncbi:MAG: hypothetical protein KME17_23405 [Cyanosarcina radialis HA8281-LM2]|nr:hypothetical protein [Cyanosarcina radialis HA8281-LM2]